MKLVSAIICSLLLAATPLFAVQMPAPTACGKQVRACCQPGGNMACCKARSTPASPSAPAAPAPAGNQTQHSLLAPAFLIWTLPANSVTTISSQSALSFSANGLPLFARNCARLI